MTNALVNWAGQHQAQQPQAAHPSSMPAQQQQIYNFLSPNGSQSTFSPNTPYSTFDPYQTNIDAQYTGAQTPNPLQPSYMGTPTMGQATTVQAAQLGQGLSPALMQHFSGQNVMQQAGGGNLSGQVGPQASFGQLQGLMGGNLASQVGPQAAEQQLMNAWMPAQQQATRSLNDNLASLGIQGGPALQMQANLQNELSSNLGQSLASLISQGQGNLLNLNSQNAGVLQNGQNNLLGLYGQNLGAISNGNANQMGLMDTQAGLNQQAGLSNQSAMNQMTGSNIANLYGANQYNATAANDAVGATTNQTQNAYQQNLANYMNMLTGGYNGNLGIIGSQLGGTQNLSGTMINQYPQYSSGSQGFGNLGSALGAGGGGGAAAAGAGSAAAGGGAAMEAASFGGF
jgi:hypothetical protein